ncbi:hypothetical protein E2C01_032534 [Portunus trituberculatus]|uniref:Uncharacterized protein n=1 Tax=Portunus trituberculatus TaxID=210409 RepID=A0A5B7F323_PORTR|nr:hypothetical protein [Portunus trituberculatus]
MFGWQAMRHTFGSWHAFVIPQVVVVVVVCFARAYKANRATYYTVAYRPSRRFDYGCLTGRRAYNHMLRRTDRC